MKKSNICLMCLLVLATSVALAGCMGEEGTGENVSEEGAAKADSLSAVRNNISSAVGGIGTYWADVTVVQDGEKDHLAVLHSEKASKARYTGSDSDNDTGDILLATDGNTRLFDASTGNATATSEDVPADPIITLKNAIEDVQMELSDRKNETLTLNLTSKDPLVDYVKVKIDETDWLPLSASFHGDNRVVRYTDFFYDVNAGQSTFELPEPHDVKEGDEIPSNIVPLGSGRGDRPVTEKVNRSLHRARGPTVTTAYRNTDDTVRYVRENDTVRFGAMMTMQRGPNGDPQPKVANWKSVSFDEFAEWKCSSAALDALRPEYTQPGAISSGSGHLNETLVPSRYHGMMVPQIDYDVVIDGNEIKRPGILFQDYLRRLPRTVHVSVSIDAKRGSCDVPVFVKLRYRRVVDKSR